MNAVCDNIYKMATNERIGCKLWNGHMTKHARLIKNDFFFFCYARDRMPCHGVIADSFD